MGGDGPPNTKLEALMAEAQMANKALARRVRQLAEQDGVRIAPDHTAVKRWLDGSVRVPRGRTPHYIARALGAKLGRRITLADIGMAPARVASDTEVIERGALYPAKASDAVALLGALTAADSANRPAVTGVNWSPDAAPAAITGYLFADPIGVDTPREPLHGSTAPEIIRATTKNLMSLDFQFGGGHTRTLLLSYFQTDIAPLLQQPAPAPLRRELFSAAAEVAQLLGWSAYDAGRHGAAQRYFVQGLRLAREAEDHMLGGRLLSNLSHQANYRGDTTHALQLARAAQTATLGKATSTVSALFVAMEARALASIGDARGCAAALNRAESLFEQRRPDSEPQWISYFDSDELAGEAAHCFRDLARASEAQSFATRAAGSAPPRTRAFVDMVNAAGALTAGNLDEATAVAIATVDAVGSLKSQRYVRYLSDFHRALLTNHAGHPSIIQFVERVNAQYPGLLALAA